MYPHFEADITDPIDSARRRRFNDRRTAHLEAARGFAGVCFFPPFIRGPPIILNFENSE